MGVLYQYEGSDWDKLAFSSAFESSDWGEKGFLSASESSDWHEKGFLSASEGSDWHEKPYLLVYKLQYYTKMQLRLFVFFFAPEQKLKYLAHIKAKEEQQQVSG